ncbi:hypothetical protein [Stutzerimonas azotifigens]|uniref:Glutamate synthase [NADPH] large chain n=1 Tax=Stutzerimonas azotifigens TaxID=291995 RepID=A0ABR5YVC1_9GAMM|nr:hypothetical protein [Stutzerimonas azotifigens]MBA1271888.1 hypothetical protein [Stutzerimonas azotifigens]
MSIQQQAQAAMSALSNAFFPLQCHILATTRKGSFSFTLVNEHGVARHSERLYPDHYLHNDKLQAVIERAQRSLKA